MALTLSRKCPDTILKEAFNRSAVLVSGTANLRNFPFRYESGDGSQRQEQGISRSPPGHEGPGGVAVQGRYAYASPEGKFFSIAVQ